MKKKDENMGHSRMFSSVPLQLTPVSNTGPVPSPNAASPTAMASRIRLMWRERKTERRGEREGREGEV